MKFLNALVTLAFLCVTGVAQVSDTVTFENVVVRTNLTLGGVPLAAWPSGTGDVLASNGMTNLSPLLGAGGVAIQTTNTAGFRAAIGLVIGTDVQAFSSTLSDWANLPTNSISAFLTEAEASALYQSTNANLTGWSAIAATSAGLQATLGQVYQATNANLTAYAAGPYAAVTNALQLTGATTTFLRSDGTQASPAGGGNVTGTGTPVDGQLVVYNGTTGTDIEPRAAATIDTLSATTVEAVNWGVASLQITNAMTNIFVTASKAAVFDSAKRLTNSVTDDSTIAALATVNGIIKGNGSGTLSAASAGTDYSTPSSTDTFTNKTLDAAGTGNVLKQTKYMRLMRPDWGDGAGAVPQTNTFTASGLMHYTFSGNAETNANYVVYEVDVPPDIDTSVEMTATFAFLSGGTDTDDVVFHIAYGLGASGAAYPVALANIATSPIVMTITPTTPAAGDMQTSAATTLTGWAASMTAGTPLLISVRRLQNSNDDSARDLYLRIAYGSTQ